MQYPLISAQSRTKALNVNTDQVTPGWGTLREVWVGQITEEGGRTLDNACAHDGAHPRMGVVHNPRVHCERRRQSG